MDRAYLSGASGTPPAAPASPSIGYPTAGSPGVSAPTVPGPYLYHMLIEEMRAVITDAELIPDQSNLNQLSQAIKLLSGSVGSVIYVAKNSAPKGYLKANGAAVSRSVYATLFAAIGTTFGVGDGSTTFNIPDLRGEFIRGFDDSRGIDSGRVFGSAQKGSVHGFDAGPAGAALGDRTGSTAVGGVGHADLGLDYDANVTTNYPNAIQGNIASGAVFANVANTAEVGAGVVRPRNVALLACIRYQ